jgi:hypothetical protein
MIRNPGEFVPEKLAKYVKVVLKLPSDTAKMGSIENQLHDQAIHIVVIPEDVRKSGKPTNEMIAEGVAFLHRDGIVVLENAVDNAHLDTLDALLSKEALEIAEDPTHHFNFGKETRNMDQAPPPQEDLMFKDVVSKFSEQFVNRFICASELQDRVQR